MGYLFFSTVVFILLLVFTGSSFLPSRSTHPLTGLITALFLTRPYWLPYTPFLSFRRSLYTPIPTTFHSDAEAGLSSATFDLSGNITSEDDRAGLDDTSKAEVQKIMKKKKVTFDEARRMYVEERFKKNGIGADGRPRDPKFVSFS